MLIATAAAYLIVAVGALALSVRADDPARVGLELFALGMAGLLCLALDLHRRDRDGV